MTPVNEESQEDKRISLELQATLAEYQALRREIEYRTRFQQGLVVANVTASAAVLASYFQLNNPLLLIVVPFLSSFLGFYWIDHSLMIDDLGTYISKTIQPRVSEIVGYSHVLLWESHVGGVKRGARTLRFGLLLAGLFLLPSILTLWLSFSTVWVQAGTGNRLLWSFGAAFALLWLIDGLGGFKSW
jgi:hypothetical protein